MKLQTGADELGAFAHADQAEMTGTGKIASLLGRAETDTVILHDDQDPPATVS
jgi:hypothetical protein